MPSNLKARSLQTQEKVSEHGYCSRGTDQRIGPARKTRQKMMTCHKQNPKVPLVGIMSSLDLISSLVQEQTLSKNPVARCRNNSISQLDALQHPIQRACSATAQKPATPPGRISAEASASWWRRSGSNRRPTACKAVALPAELRPHRQTAQGLQMNWWAE